MRIYFNSMTLPKKAAKRVQKHYSDPCSPFPSMLLSNAQNITSQMLGYENWHELEQVTKSGNNIASQLDEQCSPKVQAERINYQTKVLSWYFPVTEPILKELALRFRVSSSNAWASNFAEDGYRQNSVFYWEPFGESPEWRFRPSARSREFREELYDLLDIWGAGRINLGDYIERLEKVINEQPENIVAYLYIFTACHEVYSWGAAEPHLENFEQAIIKSLPADYPMKRKVPPFIWGTIDNRDYLRGLYYLAMGFYATGNYKKAKQWFLFLTRCSAIEMGHERFFLHDLRQPEPEGDLHDLDGKDICDRYLCPVTGKWLHKS
jgi:CRISPR/Cas system CMR-associated protein Cmr5 small subunit